MLGIKVFTVNPYGENCYILYDDRTKDAVVIDNGAFSVEEKTAMDDFVGQHGLKVSCQLLTHAHFDHILGVGDFYKKYGAKVEYSPQDDYLYLRLESQLQFVPWARLPESVAPVGRYLQENDEISVGDSVLRVIGVPGHSKGGLCYYCETEKVLFSGDSLFRNSIGRTDLPGGSGSGLLAALRDKIMVLPEDVVVYPGHGPATTIGEEKRNNPYI